MFTVGKKVICIKAHSRGFAKRGQLFELLGIKKSECKCPNVLLDIGLKHRVGYELHETICVTCKGTCSKPTKDRTLWIGSRIFAPYDDSLSELTAEHILE